MPQPKVSIIVPVYNVEKYLDRCMQSLLNQTLHDIEIIMVDDGSPDNCPVMCDGYAKKDSRVKVIHKKNAGLGFARNSGMDIAIGEYIAFLDSDDYVENTMYEKLYKKVIVDNLDACFCNIKNFNKDGKVIPIVNLTNKDVFFTRLDIDELACHVLAAPISKKYLVEIPMAAWNGIYRRPLLEKFHLRFRSEREFVSEDVMFHADSMKYYNRIEWVKEPLVYHYVDNTSSLTHKFNLEKCKAILNMAYTLKKVVSKNYKRVNYVPCLDGYFINAFSNTLFQICVMKKGFKKRVSYIKSFTKDFKTAIGNQKFTSHIGRYKLFAYCYNHDFISFLSIFYILRNGYLGRIIKRLH